MPKWSLARSVVFFAAATLTGCGGGGAVSHLLPPSGIVNAPSAGDGINFNTALAAGEIRPACGPALPGEARCVAYAVAPGNGMQAFGYTSAIPPAEPPQRRYGCHYSCPTSSPGTAPTAPPASGVPTPPPAHSGGYGPDDLQSAYNIDPSGGAGRVVAVIEEGDSVTLEADLGVYRAQFGLPPCTTANGCFSKVGQSGTSSLPKADPAWEQETTLDVDVVSAVCPNCSILVIEANSAGEGDLAASVDTAARLGANAISNSYSGGESASFANDYNHPGIAITASSGDSGYSGGAGTPADYTTVVAVGGTALMHAPNSARGWTESAWSGGGSGCSAIITKPSWQLDSGCAHRTVADVSFVASTGTGVAMYDSTPNGGSSGWMIFGGTSVGAPGIAAMYALAGNPVNSASNLYMNGGALFDVTSGSNGTCTGTYLCTAGIGYDAPTGNGTPDGIGAL